MNVTTNTTLMNLRKYFSTIFIRHTWFFEISSRIDDDIITNSNQVLKLLYYACRQLFINVCAKNTWTIVVSFLDL